MEVELWKIGDSPAAPKFNIISKPNEWSRVVGAATKKISDEALTDTKKLQLKFWTALQSKLQNHSFLKPQTPRPQHWTNLAIGRSGLRLGGILNTRDSRLGVELNMGKDNAIYFFRELEEMKQEIEADLGFSPEWNELPEKRASKIVYYLQSAPLENEDRWLEYLEWMTEHLEKYDHAFRRRVKSLDPSRYEDYESDG